jgi:predicted dehydrogenase
MLAESSLDGVIISVPHNCLSAMAVRCVQAGLHILIEKPMGVTVAEAEAVITTARTAGVRLMVNFVHRFRHEYRQAKALIESGAIGQPVLILDMISSGWSEMPDWVWDPTVAGGGMMMYGGVHSMDRLAWLAGSPIACVMGAVGTYSYPVKLEDNSVCCVVFESGTLGAIVQHKSTASRTLGIWQTFIRGTDGDINVISGKSLDVASGKEVAHLDVCEDDRFMGAVCEFVSAVAVGRDPSPSGDDGRRALAAVLALYQASSTGTSQSIRTWLEQS